jgi:uncharacterized membrane protein
MNENDRDKKIDRIIERLEALQQEVLTIRGRLDTIEGRPVATPSPAEKAPPPPLPEAIPKKPARSTKEIEARIGGKWLNYIGIVAVIIGTGFFIKYAFENEWIGPTGRVVLGMLVGLAFIAWGELWKTKYKYYSQGLAGGGIAILFLALFGAASYYSVIPMDIGRILFIVVTVFAVLLSIRYNASSIAFMGFLGGYINPILLSTGLNQQVALLAYITILDLGVLIVAFFRNWKWLNIFAFFATVAIFAGWAGKFYNVEPIAYGITQLFLTLFFIIFASLSIFYNVIHKTKTTILDLIFIFLVASVFFGSSYANLKDHYPDLMGLFSGAMAAVYMALALISYKRVAADKRLVLTFLAVALGFLVIMVPIQLEKNWITIGWAVLAASLVWIGIKAESGSILLAGTGLLIMSIGKLIFFDLSVDIYATGFHSFFNDRFLTALVVTAATFFSSYVFSHAAPAAYARPAALTFFVAAHVILLVTLSLEIFDYFAVPMAKLQQGMIGQYDYAQYLDLYNRYVYAQRLSLSGLWAVYSVVLIIIGFITRHAPSRICAIVLFFITIFKVFIFDLSSLESIYRIISFIGLGIILLLVSFLYTRFKDQIMVAVIGDQREAKNDGT